MSLWKNKIEQKKKRKNENIVWYNSSCRQCSKNVSYAGAVIEFNATVRLTLYEVYMYVYGNIVVIAHIAVYTYFFSSFLFLFTKWGGRSRGRQRRTQTHKLNAAGVWVFVFCVLVVWWRLTLCRYPSKHMLVLYNIVFFFLFFSYIFAVDFNKRCEKCEQTLFCSNCFSFVCFFFLFYFHRFFISCYRSDTLVYP